MSKQVAPDRAAAEFARQVNAVMNPSPTKSSGVKDMYANPMANTGYGSTSQVNGGIYIPDRISLDYMQLLALYRSSWIARAVVDTIPEDMLKTFPELVLGEADPEDVNDFNRMVAATQTLQKLVAGLKWGRLYGGAIGIICLAGDNNLREPLVIEDINPGTYKGLIIVDRWSGVNPSSELNADITDPPNYGLPTFYQVTTETNQNLVIHHSRVLRFLGRDLPLFEKQMQTYWGLSELEAVIEDLKRRDFAAAGISDLISRAHVIVMQEPMLAQMIAGVGLTDQQLQDYQMRMRAVAESISTNGILVHGADGNENSSVSNLSYAFGGLSEIYETFMLDVAGACGIPVSRLYGRSITGLGQSGEGDLQIYYDTIEQKRSRELRPIFDKLIPIMCMSVWGEVPEDLDYTFPAVRTLSSKERADLGSTVSQTIQTYANLGAFGKKTILREIKNSSDVTGIGQSITEEMIDAATDDPIGAMGGMDGLGGEDGTLNADGAENAEKSGESQTRTSKTAKPGAAPAKPSRKGGRGV